MILLDFFLVGATAVLGGWICRRLDVPEVLGYLGAGVLMGLQVGAFSLLDQVDVVRSLGTFAVVFRMFALGLDFDARRLAGRWRPALLAGGFAMGACTAAGVLLADLVGWAWLEGAVIGAALGTTSTGILGRALADRNIATREDARAAGAATLAEDLIAMALVAFLIVFHGADSVAEVGENALWLVVFASLALTAGAIFVPLGLDRLVRSRSDELLTLAVIAVLFGFAALSESLGAGRPVGAFLAGLVVGAAHHAPGVSVRVLPLRDLLAAAFYVSAGLVLDVRVILEVAPMAVAVVLLFVPLKMAAIAAGLRLGGVPVLVAGRAGAILGQTGTLGIVAASQPFLAPEGFTRLFAFAFVAWAITVALTGARLQVMPDFVEALLRRLGARDAALRVPLVEGAPAASRRLVGLALAAGCAVAVAAVATLAAGAAGASAPPLAAAGLAGALGLGAGLLVLPFAWRVALDAGGIVRARASRLALAPRRLARGHTRDRMGWTWAGEALGFALVLLLALLLAASLAPAALWLPLGAGAAASGIVLAAWPRLRRRLVRACRELTEPASGSQHRLHHFRGATPFGFEVEGLVVPGGTRAVGARLADLPLRRETGASLVALLREGHTEPTPLAPDLRVHEGDELVLGGTPAQIAAARWWLLEPAARVAPQARW